MMEAIKQFLMHQLWGAPVWAYLGLVGLGAIEYALPRLPWPKARSVGELVANGLARVLGRFPVLGPLLKALGTPMLVLLLVVGAAGCHTPAGKAFAACELGKLPGIGQDAFATGLEIAENPNSVKDDLVSAAARYAPGQFECAMKALAAWLAGSATATSGDGVRAALLDAHGSTARDHARAVLHEYLQEHPATSCRDAPRG